MLTKVFYKVIARSPAAGFAKVGETANVTAMTYFKEVNGVGTAKIVVPYSEAIVSALGKNVLIEIWRKIYHPNTSLRKNWYADWYGIQRGIRYFQSATGQDYVEITAYSLLHILSWRVVAWKSVDGIANNRTTFLGGKAETVLKTLVAYNMSSSATVAAGRIADGTATTPAVTVEGDSARGNTISYDCAEQNLLSVVQDICKIAGGDVDMVPNGGSFIQFKYYPSQLGTDRTVNVVGASTSQRVIFSTGFGNISEPEYATNWDLEKTDVIVGGLGTCQTRIITNVTGNGYVLGSNNYEIFADARQSNDSPVDVGNIELYNNRARSQFNFKIIQSPTFRYGLQYFLGDLCLAQYKTFSATVKIQKVSISFSDKEGEKVDVVLRSL